MVYRKTSSLLGLRMRLIECIRHYRKQFSAIEIACVRATKAVFPIMSIVFEVVLPLQAPSLRGAPVMFLAMVALPGAFILPHHRPFLG
jgi:hypothetical protein